MEEKKIEDGEGEKEELGEITQLHWGDIQKCIWEERTLEHQMAYQTNNQNSFMVKYWLEHHEEEDIDRERFGLKVVSYSMSSFETQFLESVIIHEDAKHNLLNSKSEFNYCAIPRLT